MDYQAFEGQTAFFEDYARIAKEPFDEDTVSTDVLAQLNRQLAEEQLFYRLPAEAAKEGQPFLFPFSKLMFTEDLDAAISTEFRYDGAPYVYETHEDEQP